MSTIELLRCPAARCGASLELRWNTSMSEGDDPDLRYGGLGCRECSATFPVIEGVAFLDENAKALLQAQKSTLLKHIDLAKLRPEEAGALKQDLGPGGGRSLGGDFDPEIFIDFSEAGAFLTTRDGDWWAPQSGRPSEIISKTIRAYWDDNPVARLEKYFESEGTRVASLLDLGCGVGGAIRRLGKFAERSLGIDRSFAAVLRARQVMTGEARFLETAADLLHGLRSRKTDIAASRQGPKADFVLGDVLQPPVAFGSWSIVLGLGVMDKMMFSSHFPRVHSKLAAPEGLVVQGAPYHWSEKGAEKIRALIPSSITSSAEAVEWLYEKEGTRILERQDDIPWMIFRYSRQISLYSFHLFVARRLAESNV